jgi:uncharacterized membrane protein
VSLLEKIKLLFAIKKMKDTIDEVAESNQDLIKEVKQKGMLNWIKARLSEASTWRGIVALLTAVGVTMTPEQAEAIIAAGLALIGVLGVFTKDKAATQ